LLLLICSVPVFAKNIVDDTSHIYLTNNTHEKLNVDVTVSTDDANFKQHKDWDLQALTLIPYETKEVLWFNRYQDVKTEHHYHFKVLATMPLHSDEPIEINLNAKGETVYGSTVHTTLTLPHYSEEDILTKNELKSFQGNFWGNLHTLYARTWQPFGKIYNDFQFVIDEGEQTNFDSSMPQSISLLTYNVQLLPYVANITDHLNQPMLRAKIIPAKINQFDVAIIEELFDPIMREIFVKKMGEYYPYHTKIVGQNADKILTGGVMIFSKWPIIKEDQMVYRAAGAVDAYAAKGAVYAVINKQGKMYHVLGTHLQAGDMTDKRKQMQELSDFIQMQNIAADQPVLMGGDFNTDQYNKENITFLLNTLHASLTKEMGHPYSYDGIANTMSVGEAQSTPDAILYGVLHEKPRLALNKVFVLRDLPNETMWPAFDLSDHFPVAGYFEF